MTFLPGSTLGILGSGQLGRMLALCAKRLGYFVHVLSPEADTPAGQVADAEIVAPYADLDALRRFACGVDVITIEFENIPVETLRVVETIAPVYPQPAVLETTQHRLREKTFLEALGVPLAPFHAVSGRDDLAEGIRKLGLPLVLKTAGFGYDGKGQARINSVEEAARAFEALGRQPCVLERFIPLEREISVIAARAANGEMAIYAPVENRHRHHILDITLAPAILPSSLAHEAARVTRQIVEALDLRGLLCVEFFIAESGALLVNELAPRTHNSGHYTVEAAVCSQFEQQLRAVCGLPLGSTALRSPSAMANLLGNCWEQGEPDWESALSFENVYLHLYGKREAKPGRKMGHLTAVGDTLAQAEAQVLAARQCLMGAPRTD